MISASEYAAVGLTAEEYAALRAGLGREPNALELGMVGALWSEHCSYKSSRDLLKRLGSGALSGENAGVVSLDERFDVVFKVESHNHPSYVEPYNGAATGVGGIIRDVLAMGAEPVAVLDSLHVGDGPTGKRLLPRIVAGIAGYGNAIGVPGSGSGPHSLGGTDGARRHSRGVLVGLARVWCRGGW
jgi:phosphoribosylformylglycinamidine (FGAM) synthase-like enzyme